MLKKFKLVQLLWKIFWWFLKKLNISLSCNPLISLLSIYSRESKTCVPSKTFIWICIVDLCIIAPKWKPTIIYWMDNKNVVYSDNGIIFSNKTIDTCYSIDQFKKQYVKWKKPEPKTIFIVQFPLYEKPSKGKAIGTESSSFIVWDPHWLQKGLKDLFGVMKVADTGLWWW